jgi:hypothetical protein
MSPVIRDIAAGEIARWPLGAPFAVLPRTRFLTLCIAARLLLGVRAQEPRAPRENGAARQARQLLHGGIRMTPTLNPIRRHREHCREVRAQMSNYLDGELDAPAAAAVERHTRWCPPIPSTPAASAVLRPSTSRSVTVIR